MIVKENKVLGEKYYYFVHSSGLPVYVCPKNHETAFAAVAVKYGSCDNRLPTEKGIVTVPDGTAHFLEHKMFENPDGTDSFETFTKNGGDANAFTSFERTEYIFSCTENFYINLKTLLQMVFTPHFTKESVQKEQGIIGQEIKMYEDDADWRALLGMLEGMYVNNPVRKDIAGTIESIAEITPEILYDIHKVFYHPSNTVLCICGNVDPEEVKKVCDECLAYYPETKIDLPDIFEPAQVNEQRVVTKLKIGMPQFALGIKEAFPEKSDDDLKRSAEHAIILQLLFGSSGEFYCENYESGLISDRFSYSYYNSRDWSYISIEGVADDPDMVAQAVKNEIAKRKSFFFTKEEFLRAKKVIYATECLSFNSTSEIANRLASAALEGCDMLDYASVIQNTCYEEVKERFMKGYDMEKSCLSIVFPEDE
ncbi:MAG: insulinase family protein [Ruminococcaceae bacterium]|nr:insulinase family protein [Oscillospiraceae bacterium]